MFSKFKRKKNEQVDGNFNQQQNFNPNMNPNMGMNNGFPQQPPMNNMGGMNMGGYPPPQQPMFDNSMGMNNQQNQMFNNNNNMNFNQNVYSQPNPSADFNMNNMGGNPQQNFQGFDSLNSFAQSQPTTQAFGFDNNVQPMPNPSSNTMMPETEYKELEEDNATFSYGVDDPKNMTEAQKVIFSLRERVHFLESTLNNLQSNYDTERSLSKKQNGQINGYKKQVVGVITELMQQQKYKYEKDNGELMNLPYEDVLNFMKTNFKEALSAEKHKNAKLFTAVKDLEDKNKRLETQLSNVVSNPSTQAVGNPNENIVTGGNNVNVDMINSILKRPTSEPTAPIMPNLNVTQPTISNGIPGATIKEASAEPVISPPINNAIPSKLNNLQEEISTFNNMPNNVALHQYEEMILKAIGELGIDNNDALVRELDSMKGTLNSSSFKTIIYNYRRKLIEKKLIDSINIEVPIKGYHKVELFKLTDEGIKTYTGITGNKPVESYMSKRLHQHSSYEHSFTIDKIQEQLMLNKYEVITDEKQLRFPVSVDGQDYHVEFDLIAKKNDKVYYIEVEMGTTSGKDFQDKCDKNYAFNKVMNNPIIIVSPSKKVAEANLQKINTWMRSRGSFKTLSAEKKLKVLLPYFEEIKSNKWTDKLEIYIDLTK